MGLKYVIAGSGATGASIGAFLAQDGHDVTFLARGANLKALQDKGLTIRNSSKGDFTLFPIKASSMDDYSDTPDVVFVTVKSYSINDVITLLKRIGTRNTIVIPLLNIYGTGERMQKELSSMCVTDGTIYISAQLIDAGIIMHYGDIFRVVYGLRPGQEVGKNTLERLDQIKRDLDHAGISGEYSENIRRDCFEKFMYTSPMAAAGEYFNAEAGDFQKEGEQRDTFIAMDKELLALSKAMDLGVPDDMVKVNLDILDALSPKAGTSMQRDIAKGRQSEISELVYSVEDIAKEYNVDMPVYMEIIRGLKARGLK